MSIEQNILNIHAKIQNVCDEYGRQASEVLLVAVSKKQPLPKIEAALKAGQRIFGENRVQEAYEHWPEEIRNEYNDLELHLIGPLQTNKVKEAVALFDVIQTLDREKLALKLSEEMNKQDKTPACFIQVNTGDEDQKSGISVQELSDFVKFCQVDCNLNIKGLMCIPPIDEPPAVHFAFLRKLIGPSVNNTLILR